MRIKSNSFQDGAPLPERYAFGVPDGSGKATLGANVNPHLAWEDAPEGTRSFVVLCVDSDVPTVFDDANVEGRTIANDLARMDFYHWALTDIPASITEIAEGADSNGVTPRGKAPEATPHGVRGLNDFTMAMGNDPDMKGTYAGYDGPFPPWNDERVHHYRFRVLAIDIAQVGFEPGYQPRELAQKLEGHILAEASITASYTLNASLR